MQGAELGLCFGSRLCSVTARMARPLEQAVAAIVCTFQEYAGRCGDKHKLCQAELKELLQRELPTWTPVSTREAALPGSGAQALRGGTGTGSERRTPRGGEASRRGGGPSSPRLLGRTVCGTHGRHSAATVGARSMV